MRRRTATAYSGVLKGVLALLGVIVAFLRTEPATTAVIALASLVLVPLYTRGLLRVRAQRHSFLLEQQRLAIERDRLKLQWRERQQDTYELQIQLGNEASSSVAQSGQRSRNQSRARPRRYNEPALQLIRSGGNIASGSEIAKAPSDEQPDYDTGQP
jgi:hypothetical protein